MSLVNDTTPAFSNPLAACSSILAALGATKVAFNSTQQYDQGATSARNAWNNVQKPACVVFPTVAEDVQTAMRYVYENEVDYAVQAGGHSMMQDWNNVQDGVLIHFADMNNLTYNSEADSVTLQPGIRWGEALSDLEPHGVAVAGGRVGDVGTGLLLGGGFNYLSPQVGWSAATIREMDVVLTNGTLITATPDNEHADLFKALKGGANRFGIVTRYEVDAIHTGTRDDLNWYGGLITFDNSTTLDLVNATAHYVKDVKDPKASLMFDFVYIIANGTISTVHFAAPMYNGPSLPEEIFGELLSIPHETISMGPISYSEGVAKIIDNIGTKSSPQLYGASALVGDEALFYNAFASFTNFTNSLVDKVPELTLSLGFNSIPQSQIDKSKERGGTVISPTDGNYALVFISREYPANTTAPSEAEIAASQLLFDQIPRSPGKPMYINESDKRQKVFESYGEYEFMKAVYAEYDPTRFNVRHTHGPQGL